MTKIRNSEILIYNQTKIPVSKKLVRETILKSLGFMKIKQPIEMAVLVVGDKKIRELNKIWRHKDKITNVLSFPQLSESELKRLKRLNVLSFIFGLKSRKSAKFDFSQNSMLRLGEIVINPHEILRIGARKRKEFEKEFVKLLIHGLLHLLGYEHKSDKEAKLMAKKEKALFFTFSKNLNI